MGCVAVIGRFTRGAAVIGRFTQTQDLRGQQMTQGGRDRQVSWQGERQTDDCV